MKVNNPAGEMLSGGISCFSPGNTYTGKEFNE